MANYFPSPFRRSETRPVRRHPAVCSKRSFRNQLHHAEGGVEVASQEAKVEEAEGKTAADASEAPAEAAADESIEQRHAAAPEGTAASEA